MPVMALQMESADFANNSFMPEISSYRSQNLSPSLSWKDIPEGTVCLALTCDDPDAPSGNWVHWVAYDIPAAVTEFKRGTPKSKQLAGGIKQGVNDFGKVGYDGPAPPPGPPHRYIFTLYALDGRVNIDAGVTEGELLDSIEGHVIQKAEITGLYQTKR